MIDTSTVPFGMAQNQLTHPDPVSLRSARLGTGGSIETRIYAFLGTNLGHKTLVACLPIEKFHSMSCVANRDTVGEEGAVAQRPLDSSHAKKIAVYMLKGLVETAINFTIQDQKRVPDAWLRIRSELGEQPYSGLQPIVVNIRECLPDGDDLKGLDLGPCWEVRLSQAHKLWVVDGQHRRKGMEMIFAFLDEVRTKLTYSKQKAALYAPTWVNETRTVPADELNLWETCYALSRQAVTIAVEIHLGLSIDQERQLFHDLNRLVKKIDVSMALVFDTSNPINLFTKDVLVDSFHLKLTDTVISNWDDDDGCMNRKDVSAVNARLFLNSNNINGATGAALTAGERTAKRFWQAVMAIPGFGEPHAHKKTIAAQPVVLKALAKIAHDLTISGRKPSNSEELFDKLISAIDQTGPQPIDFSHDNPMWRYYELTDEQRRDYGLESLKDYLPDEGTGNRDIGMYQASEGLFRFGAKHNDIYPIIADMIRWKLGLKPRSKKSRKNK